MDIVRQVPPVTRVYALAALATTALCSFRKVTPFDLFLNYKLVLQGQVWRLVTNFLFFADSFHLGFLFHLFFLTRYCGSLESESFRGRTADFVTMVGFGVFFILIIGIVFHVDFLGASLTFMFVYVWSRRNPDVRMNLFGILPFSAPYLAWVLMGLSLIVGGDPLHDLIGIIVGHVYYYLEYVYPELHNGVKLIKTPRFLRLLFAPTGAAAAGNHAPGAEVLLPGEAEPAWQEGVF